MINLTDPEQLSQLGKIILADLVLAGDNAAVIALATRSLPQHQQFWGRMLGMGGAVVLRVIFTLAATFLLSIHWLQVVGGALLLWIAYKLVKPQGNAEAHSLREGTSLRDAVLLVIMADVIMSLDNVLAVAGVARDHTALLVIGLLLSIPLVIWGSGLLANLMNKFVWIIWVAGGVLGFTAGEMILHDKGLKAQFGEDWLKSGIPHVLYHALPWVLGAVLFLMGWYFFSRVKAGQKESPTPSA